MALVIDSGWRLGGLTYDRRRSKRAGVETIGARERVILLRHLVGCGKGSLARAGHVPDERGAAPTCHELLGRGAYVPRFLSPSPPLSYLFSSISSCTLRARRLAPCGVSPPGLLPARAPSDVSHHLRRLSPPLLASRAHSIGFL